MNFKIITALLISLFLINCSYSMTNYNLYSVTDLGNNQFNFLIVQTFESTVLLNKTFTLPIPQLSIQGIAHINYTTEITELLCFDKNQKLFLVSFDKNGVFTYTYGIENTNSIINNGELNQNYLIGTTESQEGQIYLPGVVNGENGLKIINWNFNSKYSVTSTFSVQNTNDIDSTVNPIGTLQYNGDLIVAYQSTLNNPNIISIVYLNLNGTLNNSDSSSDSSKDYTILTPYQKYQIKIQFDSSLINFMYTGYDGELYIVLNGTSACQVQFDESACYNIYDIQNDQTNYPSFLISQDKSSVITVSNSDNNQLELGFWTLDFQAGMESFIPNYWLSNKKSSLYSYFAI